MVLNKPNPNTVPLTSRITLKTNFIGTAYRTYKQRN